MSNPIDLIFLWRRRPGHTIRTEPKPFLGEFIVAQSSQHPSRFDAVTVDPESIGQGFTAELAGEQVHVNGDSRVSQAFQGEAQAPRRRSLPISRAARQAAAKRETK